MSVRDAGAQHVQSRLMRESLVDKNVTARTNGNVVFILLDVNIIQIGGCSIIDRGRSALLPLLDEIVANQSQHRMIIEVGAGVRSRHIFSAGLGLGLPTGARAALSAKDSAQNADMVSCLLAQHGFVYLEAPFVMQLLSAMLAAALGAVFNGNPPYSFWENPLMPGKLLPHGSDTGSYLVAEVFGGRSMIFLMDVDGLYVADPKKDATAEFISEIGVQQLIDRKLPTLSFEPAVLELLGRAKLVKGVLIVKALTLGNLSRALAAAPVGTLIRQ